MSSCRTTSIGNPRTRLLALDDVRALGLVTGLLWLAISTAWIRRGGYDQLLWLCDLATLGTAAGLLLRSPLLLTAQFVGMFAYHVSWQIDFLVYAATHRFPFAATAYMFSGNVTAYEKAISFLQHTIVLPLCFWGIC